MSIFGWKVAITYVFLGLLVSVVGGTVIEKLQMEDQIEGFIRNVKSKDIVPLNQNKINRSKYAWNQVISTVKKVLIYVIIGVGIGALIHNWLPKDWIVKALGDENPLGVFIATLLGAPMHADIFGTIPIAEVLLLKGAKLGVVLSFMMSVTTLSLPSMIMLKKVIKPKLLFVFVLICIIGIILVGYLFNLLQYILI